MAATALAGARPAVRATVPATTLPALVLAAVAALSGPLEGLYATGAWSRAAVAAAVAAVALLVAAAAPAGRPAYVALAGMALLGAWSLASLLWSGAPGQTWVEVHRAGLYFAVLLIAILGAADRRAGVAVLAVLVAGSAATTAVVLATMLVADAGHLFTAGRLAEPTGYPGAQAALALVGLWPLLGIACRRGHDAVRGAALAGAVLLTGTVVLTGSRAGVAAFVVTALVLVTLLPGRLLRGWALLHVTVATGAALPWLLAVGADGTEPSVAVTSTAGAALLLAGALAGLLWAVLAPSLERPAGRRASLAVLVVLALGGLAGSVHAVGDPVSAAAGKLRELRSLAPETTGSARLTAAGGHRWDLWRVAAGQFADAPFTGVGAGAFDTTYFRDRRQPDPVRQPHSLPLQLLGELGVAGGLGLLLLLAGVVLGVRQRLRAGVDDLWLLSGAAGICTAWVVQGSVDWLWQLPSLTVAALLAAGVLLAPGARTRGPRRPRAALAGRVLTMVALAAAGAAAAQHVTAERLRDQASAALADDPSRARLLARRASATDPNTLAGRYLEAAAHARMGDYGAARAALLEAARREPDDYVPWTLMGDLAVRRGELDAARHAYARAAALNPLDPSLALQHLPPRS